MPTLPPRSLARHTALRRLLPLACLLWGLGPSPSGAVGDQRPIVLREPQDRGRFWLHLRRAPSGRLRWVHLDRALRPGLLLRSPDALVALRRPAGAPAEVVTFGPQGRVRRRGPLPALPVAPPRIDPLGRLVLVFESEIRWYDPVTLADLRRPQIRIRRAHSTPPALALDGAVTVSLRDGYLTRVDGNGRWQWRTSLPGTRPGPPVLVKGDALLCTGTGRTLTAISPAGKVRWSRRIGRCDVRPVRLPGGDVLVATPGRILRFSHRGLQRGSLPTSGRVHRLVAGTHGHYYGLTNAGDLVAFEANGQTRWLLQSPFRGEGALAAHPGGGVVAAWIQGHLIAVDPAGRIRWHARIPRRPPELAVRWDGAVVVLSARHSLRLIDPPPPAPPGARSGQTGRRSRPAAWP